MIARRLLPPLLALLASACHRDAPQQDSPQEGLLVVADTGHGRMLLVDAVTLKVIGEQCIDEMFPELCAARPSQDAASCLLFGVEPSPDEAAVEIVFGWYDASISGIPGAVTRFIPGHPPKRHWTVDALDFPTGMPGAPLCPDPEDTAHPVDSADPSWTDPACMLNMPHVAEWSLDGRELLIADTANSRILWTEPGNDARTRVPHALGPEHPDWGELQYPNNVQIYQHDDHVWLLSTFKSSVEPEVAERNTGRIVLWDVTDTGDPQMIWSYPESGFLAAVHHGQIFQHPDGPLLIYAHSFGASDDFVDGGWGSVGLARFNGQAPPEYIGDVVLSADAMRQTALLPMGFVREAELVGDDTLLVTDSGCENQGQDCPLEGQVLRLVLPSLASAGLSGAFSPDHETQRFLPVDLAQERYWGGLRFPFEADFYTEEEFQRVWGDRDTWSGCPQ